MLCTPCFYTPEIAPGKRVCSTEMARRLPVEPRAECEALTVMASHRSDRVTPGTRPQLERLTDSSPGASAGPGPPLAPQMVDSTFLRHDLTPARRQAETASSEASGRDAGESRFSL